MTFVSFAQNGEDVILWRALKDIDKGFYIDAGANDPVTNSVTKAFYDRGWRGINIEPVRYWHERLVADRPEDINLCLAVGERAGLATIHEIPDTGLSTMSAEVAATHQRSGRTSTPTLVPVLRLDDICATHAPSDIHFLKIDVEGVEEQVLCGLDLNRWRPWILVIEATFPNSPEAQHQAWESMVLERDYRFAYFDGLSRYYVADEKAELIPRLGVQPNVFDDFARAREQAQIAALDARTSELAQLRQELEQCQRVWRESEEAHRRAVNAD